VLFLDEPTTGLDPQNRASIWKYIRNLKERSNLTLLLTTHYMEEAEELADMVGIIDHGKIVVEGTPKTLIEKMGTDTIRIAGKGNSDAFVKEIESQSFTQGVVNTDGLIQIGVDSGKKRIAKGVSIADRNEFSIEDISIAKPSLGDVFLKYTGRQLRDK